MPNIYLAFIFSCSVPFFVCALVWYMYICMRVCVAHVCTETRGGQEVPCSITRHLVSLRQGLSRNLQLEYCAASLLFLAASLTRAEFELRPSCLCRKCSYELTSPQHPLFWSVPFMVVSSEAHNSNFSMGSTLTAFMALYGDVLKKLLLSQS